MQLPEQFTQDTKTKYKFKLAGKTAVIACRGDDIVDGWVATQVTIGNREPVTVGAFCIADADRAWALSEENMEMLQSDGTLRPTTLRAGDVVDIGPRHNCGQIQAICDILGLNAGDITEYEYVDLTIRSVGLALAKELIASRRRSTSVDKAKSGKKSKRM